MVQDSAYRFSAKEQLEIARARRDLVIAHLVTTTDFSRTELLLMAEYELVFYRLSSLIEARQACRVALARLLREACSGPRTEDMEADPSTLRSAQLRAA